MAAHGAGGKVASAGTSVLGRPLVRIDLGTLGKPVVLLTALMHGVEVIGSLALLDVLEKLGQGGPLAEQVLTEAHLVVLPVTNPDAFSANMQRVLRGDRAWQRCNSNGVDLNRNFPKRSTKRYLHPFAGSRYRLSPHYGGVHALSEPESRAVRQVAVSVSPRLSLAFHSFGNMLLYPWAYTDQENPRASEYRALGAAMNRALATPYEVRQARLLYSIAGDMDDWLDAEVGALAFTVEVSRPSWKLAELRSLIDPFSWMNPQDVRATVENLTPGIIALMSSALGFRNRGRPTLPLTRERSLGLDLAAK